MVKVQSNPWLKTTLVRRPPKQYPTFKVDITVSIVGWKYKLETMTGGFLKRLIFLSPPVHCARCAHMHHFLSVRLDWTKNHQTTHKISKPAFQSSDRCLSHMYAHLKVGSLPTSSCILLIIKEVLLSVCLLTDTYLVYLGGFALPSNDAHLICHWTSEASRFVNWNCVLVFGPLCGKGSVHWAGLSA